jgi:hypothetical protein
LLKKWMKKNASVIALFHVLAVVFGANGKNTWLQIPSAYGPQRLDVLRRLEQVRHMEPESSEKPALPSSRKLEGSL